MKTLKQILEELENLNIAIQKSNWYSEEEAHEEIIIAVKEWLQQKLDRADIEQELEAPFIKTSLLTECRIYKELLEELD